MDDSYKTNMGFEGSKEASRRVSVNQDFNKTPLSFFPNENPPIVMNEDVICSSPVPQPEYIRLTVKQEQTLQLHREEEEDQRIIMWMPKPALIPGVPAGLEYLVHLDQILVKQQIEFLEAVTGFETNNRYIVKNSLGQQIYFAREESDACIRNCCGSERPFIIHLCDSSKIEVIRVIRLFRYCCAWCCCRDEIEVESPPGTKIGSVKQIREGLRIRYLIQDHEKGPLLKIQGASYCLCYCPGEDIPFQIVSLDGKTEIGLISKQWTNLVKEWFTDADNFGIHFPMDLDVKVKAIILGSVFLIDFMFFEDSSNQAQ